MKGNREWLPAAVGGPLEGGNELLQAQTEGPAERPQLNHVDTPLAPFALADERLRLPDFLCEVYLGQANPPPCLPEHPKEHGVLCREWMDLSIALTVAMD